MKIIHCADIHLDSKLTANLDSTKAKERRLEILSTFLRMIDYAKENQVEVILIAGDLFDTSNIYVSTQNAVMKAVTDSPQIRFYYLNGNHDASNFVHSMDEIPSNLRLFQDTWSSEEFVGKDGECVTITGVELSEQNRNGIYDSLVLDQEKVNIVMMHGQQNRYASKDKTEVIHLEALKNKGIDYLALGHVHEPSEGTIDSRGKWRYCGCLEGRGFDECNEHGFVLLELLNHSLADTFILFAERMLYTIDVDITGCMTSPEMLDCVKRELEESIIQKKDLVKVILKGNVDVNCEKNVEYLCSQLKNGYYFLKIYDETRLLVDYNDYTHDVSLKGEYVRVIMGDDSLSEEEKAELIRAGIQALAGEVLDE